MRGTLRFPSWLGLWLCLLVTSCASNPSVNRVITVRAIVPEMSGDVFLTGNLPGLGPWRADGLLMQGEGALRTATVQAPSGQRAEFKITLGRWDREGLGASGTVLANTRVDVDGDMDVTIRIASWKRDVREYIADPSGAGVRGSLIYWPAVRSDLLEEPRTVSIFLPPHYTADSAARLPVIYMQDGQNLFDPRIASTGVDWGVDEAMDALVQQAGAEPAIVVGVWNTPARRLEYAPESVLELLTGPMARHAADEFPPAMRRARAYVRFLVEELKPRIDAQFRTRAEPEATFLMGSSMGGLISLYAMAEYPDVFGAAAGLSMHWPVSTDQGLISDRQDAWRPAVIAAFTRYLEASRLSPEKNRIWIDRGTVSLDYLYGPYQQVLVEALQRKGYTDQRAMSVRVYDGADHNEAAWRARLKDPMSFLLGHRGPAQGIK